MYVIYIYIRQVYNYHWLAIFIKDVTKYFQPENGQKQRKGSEI